MELSEPLGLPQGSVRAVLALIALGTSAFLWATAQQVPVELLLITTMVVNHYYTTRQNAPAPEPKLPEPYLGDGE